MKVLFATKTWQGDWQKMLAGAFDRKVASCQYPFDQAILYVNNGVPSDIYSSDLPVENVEHWKNWMLDFFHLSEEDFKGGYYYSNCELTSIFLAGYNLNEPTNFDYICYLQGDCLIDPQYDWITPGIQILENRPQISVVSPASAVNTWHDENGLDHYFSDQAWLVRVSEFRNPEVYQYSLKVPHDPDYPDYGGNNFEHMVGCYLKATGKYRKIIEEAYLVHPTH